jgi:hypothetical protein
MVGVFIIDLGMKYMGRRHRHVSMRYKPERKKNQAHEKKASGIHENRELLLFGLSWGKTIL